MWRDLFTQATHVINSPYVHIEMHDDVSQKNLQTVEELFNVLSSTQSSEYEKDFYEPLYEVNHPLSSFEHLTIKESDNNPYTLVASNPVFAKLLKLLQYGIDMHPIWNHGTIYLSNHTRGLHSLDVAFNYEMIARWLKLPEREISLGIIASLLHDVATPAFGDITMKAIPDLKEEQNFVEYMKKYPELCNTIEAEYGITIEEVWDIVNSKHPLYTHILDIADKFAYTARDVEAVFPTDRIGAPQIFPKADKYANIIYKIREKDLRPFDILLDVSLSENKEKIVFGDADKLLNILFLRAYMHNMIYLNHNVWGKEFLIGMCLRYLVENNTISKEALQHKEIQSDILHTYSNKNVMPNFDLVGTDNLYSLKKVDTLEKVQYIINNAWVDTLPLIVKVPRFKVWDNFLVKWKDNKEMPLSERYPNEVESLRKVWLQTECFVVLWLSRRELEKYPDFYEFIKKESISNVAKFLK